MKTQNITTAVKQLTLVLVFAVISLANVNAKDITSKATDVATDTEEAINVEAWMSDLADWNIEKKVLSEKVEKEAEMEIEEWMLNPNDDSWESTQVVEEEKEMEVENWMTDLNEWK